MPPPAKKSATPAGKDIRAFFGGAPRKPIQTPTLKNSSQKNPIEISDSEEGKSSRVSKPLKATPPSPKKSQPKRTPISAPAPKKKAVLSDSEDEDSPQKKSTKKPELILKRKKAVVLSDEDEEETKEISPPKKKAAVASSSKHKPAAKPRTNTSTHKANGKRKPAVDDNYEDEGDDGVEQDDDDDDDFFMDVDEDEAPKKETKTPAKSSKPKAKPTPKAKTKPKVEAEPKAKPEAKAIAEPKETTIDEAEKPKPKFNWAAAKAARLAGPSAPGSKPIPEAASPDCLAGLSFVFTGELSSLARDEAIDLAKRFGGRVVTQPSSRTSYVVLGDNAGPSKLTAIKKHHLATLSEDEFLNLIATRKGPSELDEKTKKKKEKELKEIQKSAKEMAQREKEAKIAGPSRAPGTKQVGASSQLWTDRYAPRTLKEICGNKGQVEKLQLWLNDWSGSLKCGFKKPGKNAMNVYRAALISGPPGIGKTTSAHLCAKMAGFTPIELNASDARSKKLVESSTNITNTSLDGWMGGGETTHVAGVPITDKSCLIMDEVDGMSAGDRGGVGALAALIKKTKIPIICIANDKSTPKMRPLVAVAYQMPFRKPDAAAVRSRILSIVYKEGMKVPPNVLDQLVTGVNSDIRQVLNMLSTWKLSSSTMDFDQGKELAKMNEKYAVMTPFNIIHTILGPNLFSATARETLGDKMELYFHDYSFVPLFMQENYLRTQPAKVRSLEGPDRTLKQLELMDQAASSISDGDLVDALIHGPEQHWTLMPTHAILSTIRPASLLYGSGGGWGSDNQMGFPQWLGQNSKQNKLARQLTDVQIRMRLKVSGDKSEIRQSYIPALFPHIVQPLMDDGSSAVDDVIEQMDSYYISREDWDTIVELGLGDHRDDVVLKKIASATKTALTRKYNAREHPIPFHKGQDLGKQPKKLAGGPAPDLEEAFEVEDEIPDDAEDEKKSEDSDGIEGDTLIQQGGKKKAAAKPKGKQR